MGSRVLLAVGVALASVALVAAIPPNTTSNYQRILGFDGGATVPVEIVGGSSGGGALPVSGADGGPLSVQLVAGPDGGVSVLVDQGLPAARTRAWPVYLTDGGVGSFADPIRVDPVGTTAQPVSGTVTATQGAAAAKTGAWPVYLTDGGLGSSADPIRTDPVGATAQPVVAPDGGPVKIESPAVLGQEQWVVPSVATPMDCNTDGGTGAFTLIANANGQRHGGVIINVGSVNAYLNGDAGILVTGESPPSGTFDIVLLPTQSLSISGPNVSGLPIYACCGGNADGGCKLAGRLY